MDGKRQRTGNEEGSAAPPRPCLDASDWESLAASYKAHDETREMVIKRCRDMQKLSKNAIFSLHRGDLKGAEKQIGGAKAISRELLPIIADKPALRQGSFANACEEYAEALIFHVYLMEGRVLPWSEASWLTCEEYLGGLMDFTGEVGRLAVAKATERDEPAVIKYQSLLDDLLGRFEVLDPRHPSLSKKQGPLEATCSKVQRLVYELSLSKASALMCGRVQAAVAVVGSEDPQSGP